MRRKRGSEGGREGCFFRFHVLQNVRSEKNLLCKICVVGRYFKPVFYEKINNLAGWRVPNELEHNWNTTGTLEQKTT